MAKTKREAVSIDNLNRRTELDSIHLTNYLLWKDQKIEIKEGITRVKGRNRSGKTLFFNGLKQAWWGANAGKRGTSAAKMPAKSKVHTVFRKGDTKYDLSVGPSSIIIKKDGQDMGLRGVNAPREALQQTIRVPKSLYDATVHLSVGQHPLTHSTPAARMQWIGDVFNINQPFDDMLKKVEREYRKVKDSEVEVRTIRSQLKEVHVPIAGVDPKLIKQEIDTTRERIITANEELQRRDHRQNIMDQITVRQPIATLNHLIDKSREALKKYRTYRKEYQRWETYNEQLKEYQGAQEKYTTMIDEYRSKSKLMGLTEEQLRKRELKLLRQYESMKDEAERWEEEEPLRKQLKKFKGKKNLSRKEAAKVISTLEAENDTIELALQALNHKHSGSKCPTCRSKLSPDRQAKLVKNYKLRLKAIPVEIDNAMVSVDYHDLLDKITVMEFDETLMEGIVKKIKAIRKALSYKKAVGQLEARLGELDKAKPKKVAKPPLPVDDQGVEVKNVRRRIKHLIEQVEVLKTDKALTKTLNSLPESDGELAKAKTSHLRVMVKTFEEALEALELDYTEALRISALRKEGIALRRGLKNNLAQAKHNATRATRLAILREAMGPKGLRLVKIKQAIGYFVAELNRKAHLVWGDPLVFHAEINDDGFHLFAERDGNMGDLTTLSGSEDKCWRSLCALVLLQMLPDIHRTDFVILDELESNLDSVSRYKYAREFLPELQSVVPKVIVVSPLGDEEFSLVADHEYQVVKTRGVSKLEKVK